MNTSFSQCDTYGPVCLLHLYLLVSSADNFCKQFDTLVIFLKESFEKVDFEKISRRQKVGKKLPGGKALKAFVHML